MIETTLSHLRYSPKSSLSQGLLFGCVVWWVFSRSPWLRALNWGFFVNPFSSDVIKGTFIPNPVLEANSEEEAKHVMFEDVVENALLIPQFERKKNNYEYTVYSQMVDLKIPSTTSKRCYPVYSRIGSIPVTHWWPPFPACDKKRWRNLSFWGNFSSCWQQEIDGGCR